MAGLNDKLSNIQKFLNVLSWKKILQLAAFLFVISLALATYELRESIYNYANQTRLSKVGPPVEKLSKKSIAEVDVVAKKASIIVGIQILVVDFQKNTRTPIYTTTSSPVLAAIYEEYAKNSISDAPLFTGDVINNRHVVELINGEFVCYPFSETMVSKVAPAAGKHIHSACAVGIPPYYGRFTGAVVIYTSRQPTPEDVDQIRTLSKTLSTAIYERDFR